MTLAKHNPKPKPRRRRIGVAAGASAAAILAIGAFGLFPIWQGGPSATERVHAAVDNSKRSAGDVVSAAFTVVVTEGKLQNRFSGDYVQQGTDFSVQMQVGGSELKSDFDLRRVGAWDFNKSLFGATGRWDVATPADGDEPADAFPFGKPRELLAKISERGTFREVGTEEIAGQRVTRYEVTEGLKEVASALELGEEPGSRTVAIEMWVDEENDLIRRVTARRTVPSYPGPDSTTTASPLTEEFAVDLDYDNPDKPSITFPGVEDVSRSSVYRLEALKPRFEAEQRFRVTHPNRCEDELANRYSPALVSCVRDVGDRAFADVIEQFKDVKLKLSFDGIPKVENPKIRQAFAENNRCMGLGGLGKDIDIDEVQRTFQRCSDQLEREIRSIEAKG